MLEACRLCEAEFPLKLLARSHDTFKESRQAARPPILNVGPGAESSEHAFDFCTFQIFHALLNQKFKIKFVVRQLPRLQHKVNVSGDEGQQENYYYEVYD